MTLLIIHGVWQLNKMSRNIHESTLISDGKAHKQIGHILIDRRRHSSVHDVQSFRGADSDTALYLMVAEVREGQTE
jgi:exopolysaccharide biosynthesis protein